VSGPLWLGGSGVAALSACWARWARLSGLVTLLAALLAGCVAQPQPGAGQEIRTDSDQTTLERRARVRLELASAYFARGQANTALDEIKLALVAKPDLPEAFNLRGLVYASLGEQVLAEQSFQRALQINPRDGDTMHNFGWFLCQQRRFDEGDQQFAAAMAAPQYTEVPRTLMARGLCQARAGRWQDAERSLSRSFELDPSNPSTTFAYAEVLYRRGEYERARFYVRRLNGQSEQSNAQSLWLAARIERRMGNTPGVEDFSRQLRDRFPDSAEARLLRRGEFDD
jgi:type IV pilus assembly protein PilF